MLLTLCQGPNYLLYHIIGWTLLSTNNLTDRSMSSCGKALSDKVSPCVILALLTLEKDGMWRMCVYSLAIHKIAITYRFFILILDDLLDSMVESNVFSNIDLRSGYHHISVRKRDEWKLLLRWRTGYYDWMVMPFSLSNVPITFIRIITQVSSPYLGKIVVAYFDDTSLYTVGPRNSIFFTWYRSWSFFGRRNCFVDLKKCEFMSSSVYFLGFIMCNKQVSTDADKVKDIRD